MSKWIKKKQRARHRENYSVQEKKHAHPAKEKSAAAINNIALQHVQTRGISMQLKRVYRAFINNNWSKVHRK